MAICPIIVHFSTWHARSMHDVACEFVDAVVRSKDAQKKMAQTSLSHGFISASLTGVGDNQMSVYCLQDGVDGTSSHTSSWVRGESEALDWKAMHCHGHKVQYFTRSRKKNWGILTILIWSKIKRVKKPNTISPCAPPSPNAALCMKLQDDDWGQIRPWLGFGETHLSSSQIFTLVKLILASCTDALWACHAIFLVEEEEDCVTSSKRGAYKEANPSLATWSCSVHSKHV